MSVGTDRTQTVIDALNERRGTRELMCQICARRNWTLEDGFVAPTLQRDLYDLQHGFKPTILPLVALTCSNCGNTLLLNVLILGLGHLFGLAASEPS